MATRATSPRRISLPELDAALEQACAEGWRELGIIGPVQFELQRPRGPETRTFYLRAPLRRRLAKLVQLTQLSSLDLSGNQIGPEGARVLAQLTQLTSLDLRDNQIGDEGARALAQLTQLTFLDLRGNQIGDEGARALAKLTQLTSLDLGYNGVGDEGARALAKLTQLTSLDLSHNRVEDEGARALVQLTQLTLLDLSHNRVGDEGAQALAQLTQLTFLDLRGNQMEDEGALALAKLTQLTFLDLSHNLIEDEGAQALAKLTQLTSLDLSHNLIGDEGARTLAKLTQLTSLDLRSNQVGAKGARALAQLAQLTSLDLSHNRVGAEGARALAQLGQLTSLDLNSTRLGAKGARALAQLTQLTSLDLHSTRLGDEGARALAQLTQLTSLDLRDNQIGDEGARALASLTQLTSLDLSDNEIGDEGARALAPLTQLTSLDLSDNEIGDEGVRALAPLTQLTSLDLSHNRVEDEGVRALAPLTQLTSLDLSHNGVGAEAARALAQLTQLTSLDLRHNGVGDEGVRVLLDSWCDSPHSATLQYLALDSIQGTKSVLPKETLQSYNAQFILAAYRRFRDAGRRGTLRPLNEAKLVVVGNEAVGKTSLIRYLVHGKPLDFDEKKTSGAALHERIDVNTWSVHQSPVRLNVWDFGGQEIMRGTHRFFLTERSLYLLVLEDRREDDRSIYEWLEIIAQRGGDSPIIVVINKSDSEVPRRQLDEAALRRAYPAIVGFARTSCNAGEAPARSIASLRTQIVTTLNESARLKHVHDPVPQSWLRVKDAIVERARSYSVLPARNFEQLCESDKEADAERITEPHEQRALLALLHDLGIVVAHGLRQDARAVWRECTILDPNWLTGAIYALINNPTVREQDGKLRYDQLGELLEPTRYPARWHELILSMMQEPELRLCLPLPHSNPPSFLLPDALSVREPDYDVWPAASLRFRYEYKQLPADFIPRLIAAAYANLTDKPTLWRTGVVLGAEGCLILVRCDTANHRVEIYVAGTTGKRAALSIVRNYFDMVHRHYGKLSVEARVPLPDQSEVDVVYDDLVRREHEDGIDYTWRPDRANRKYSVRELLEGVRDDEARRPRTHGHDGHVVATRPVHSSSSPYHGKIDFGILTILEDENEAVLRRFTKLATEERQWRYRIRSLALPDGGEYRLAILRCAEQGNADAQASAHALLEDLSPRFVLVVGIAGGVPSYEFSLGDVVVSNSIVNFSVEAVIRDSKREYALTGGPLLPLAARLAADVRGMVTDGELDGWNAPDKLTQSRPPVDLADDRFYGELDWVSSVKQKIRRHFADKAPRGPLVTTGAIASSDRLIKDDETLSVWLKIARQVVAVEMESAGIYKATHGRGVPFLAIRGISDVVGFKRDHDWTTYACETAAAFTRAFLLARPIAPIGRP